VALPAGEQFDGVSMVPLLAGAANSNSPDPASAGPHSFRHPASASSPFVKKTAAFSQYPRRVKDAERPWASNSILHHNRTTFTHMGYSVRTEAFRYIQTNMH
jgi:hypothetical protein